MHVEKKKVQQLATKVVPSAEDPELSYNVEDCLEDQTDKYILQRCPLLQTARTNVWPTTGQLHTELYSSREELAIEKKKKKKRTEEEKEEEEEEHYIRYSFACLAYCHDLCPSNFCLPSSFNFTPHRPHPHPPPVFSQHNQQSYILLVISSFLFRSGITFAIA